MSLKINSVVDLLINLRWDWLKKNPIFLGRGGKAKNDFSC